MTRSFFIAALLSLLPTLTLAADWPMLGHDPAQRRYHR